MYTDYLLNGFFVGFIVGTPVGPVSIVVLRQLITRGKLQGIICGLGSASADAVYGIIFAFGLTFVSDFLIRNQTAIQLLGGIIILFMGIRILFSSFTQPKGVPAEEKIAGTFAATFFLSATNPVTLISYAALLAGFGFESSNHNQFHSLCLVIGIFWGAFIWWIILAAITSILHNKITPNRISVINRLFGIIISVLALIILIVRIFT